MRRCLTCNSRDIDLDWRCRSCGGVPSVYARHISFVDVHGSTDNGFDGEFFKRLASLENGFWWFDARNALIMWAITKWFSRAKSFLEIGCGTGFVIAGIAQQFPCLQTYASEIFAEAMPFVSARCPLTKLYQFDARNLPFRTEFDVIGAFDVIEHIDDHGRALEELHRALAPGGGIIITVPQHQQLWTAADDFAHHKRRYSRRSLRDVLAASGFKVVAMRSFVSLLMPALLASRFLQRGSRSYDPTAEFAIGPAVNRALAGIMALERTLIRFGASFPFGGSLLAVAYRDDTS